MAAPSRGGVFARLCVANKVITEEELQGYTAYLEDLQAKGVKQTLEEFLVGTRKLKPAQAEKIEFAVEFQLQRHEDKCCLKELLRREQVTEKQAHDALAAQTKRFREKKVILSTLDLLAENSILTADVVDKVRREVRGEEPLPELATDFFAPVTEAPQRITRGQITVLRREETASGRPVCVLELEGELDTNSSKGLDDMLTAVEEDWPEDESMRLVLDMTELRSISDSGIDILNALQSTARQRGGVMRLVGVREDVKQALMLVGLADKTYARLDEAIAYMRGIG